MLRPLVALAYVDRVMESRVVDLFVIVPLVGRVFVLTVLFVGGVVGFALYRARDLDALLFAGRIREVGRWTVFGGDRQVMLGHVGCHWLGRRDFGTRCG